MAKGELPHKGHRERVRALVEKGGLRMMPEYQVLEYILFGGIPYKDTKPIAYELLAKFGNIKGVFDAELKDLMTVKNMTKNAALILRSYADVFSAFYDLDKVILNPNNIVAYIKRMFDKDSTERLMVVSLRDNGEVLANDIITYGSLDSFILPTADILGKFLRNGVKKLFLAHNHPSGEAIPSADDIRSTRILKGYLGDVGVRLIDHFIVGKEYIYSMELEVKLSTDINSVYPNPDFSRVKK